MASLLQQLRAAVAQGQPPALAPPQPEQPCPFTFGPWLPRTDPGAHPGEAQRAVLRRGELLGWWRREWITPTPAPGDPPGSHAPFAAQSIYSPSGALLAATTGDAHAMLLTLAESHP